MEADWRNTLRDRTITLEFYIDDGKQLHVICNRRDYTFPRFWREAEHAETICRCLYDTFREQHPHRFTLLGGGKGDWRKTLLQVINNHLRSRDDTLDVLIRGNGTVELSLEH